MQHQENDEKSEVEGRYKITTKQYGEFIDVKYHKSKESLRHDLACIAMLTTIEILEITRNGNTISTKQASEG